MPDPAENEGSEVDHGQIPPVHLVVRLELPGKPVREFSYDFRQTVITLGRDPTNDIQIPLTTVSRRHSRIFFEQGDYFLEDLGSTHGTNHNDKTLGAGEKRLLRDGDRVSVMSFSILFKTTAGTLLDRQPGEKTEALARRMVQEVLSSLGGSKMEPPALRVMNGADEGRRYEIREEHAEVTLGRSPECDLPLNDQNISRRHCLIKRNWHGFTAQDLGSKNGVLVNGRRIEGAEIIKDGDELQVGGVKLIFIDPPSRLLDQFGGIGIDTSDLGAQQKDGVAVAAGASGGPAISESGKHAEDDEEDSAASDPHPEMDVEPPDHGGEDDAEEPLPPPDPALVEEMEKLGRSNKKGGRIEILILIAGGLFLVGAVLLIVFLAL